MANEVNNLLENNNLMDLIKAEKVKIAYHPSVIKGQLGLPYKDGYMAWAKDGAVMDLMNKFGKKDNTTKFFAGSLGSVWFDIDLTGGHGTQKRTKKVRVALDKVDGMWYFILDATFDEKW